MEEVILQKRRVDGELWWMAHCPDCKTDNLVDTVDDYSGEPGGMEWCGFDCECGVHLHLNPPRDRKASQRQSQKS